MAEEKTLKDILYAGVFFDEETSSELYKYITPEFKKNTGYMPVANLHITTGYGGDMSITTLEQSLKDNGFPARATISTIGVSDKCIALGIDKFKLERCHEREDGWMDWKVLHSDNEHIHITLAVANGGKPVESNDITDWQEIPELEVYGKIKLIFKRK